MRSFPGKTSSPALAILALAAASFVSAQGEEARAPRSRAALYEAACAACHGADGRGAPRERVGFDVPLPDFTDCSFASREPDADWLAVVHDGGPARGFDPLMPAFGEAMTAEEMQVVLDHLRELCGNPRWPRGELNLPRALVTEKAYPEDEAVLTTSVDAEGPGAVVQEVVYERRFGERNHFEIAVPFGARKSEANGWAGGVGDVALGVKRVLVNRFDAGTIVSVIGEVVLPTGRSEAGLGKDVTIFEPSVSLGKILPRDAFLQFQGGFELVSDRDAAEHEGFWRIVFGRSFTEGPFGRTWSPMVEVLGSSELGSGGKAAWDVVPQLQVTLNTRQHIMLNAGVVLPLGEREDRPVRVMVYLLWDWFDGGLLEGW